MAITHVVSIGVAQGASGGTTSAIDTTGASLIVVSVPSYAISPPPTVSDNKGNTYTILPTLVQGTSLRHQLFYAVGAITVGTGHTFTVTGGAIYNCIVAHAFAGVASYASLQSSLGSTVSPLAPGSVTPITNGSLIFTILANDTASQIDIIPSSFTNGLFVPYGGGINFGTHTAYLVQPTAGAINPSWSWTAGGNVIASVAVFTPAVINNAQLSQLPLEVIVVPPPSIAQLSQLPIEVLVTPIIPTAQLSQLPIEILVGPAVAVTETTRFFIIMS